MNDVGAWAVVLGWTACVGLGVYVASQKRRGVAEAVILAGLFGPLGILVILLLPSADKIPPGRRGGSTLLNDRDALPRRIDFDEIADGVSLAESEK